MANKMPKKTNAVVIETTKGACMLPGDHQGVNRKPSEGENGVSHRGPEKNRRTGARFHGKSPLVLRTKR